VVLVRRLVVSSRYLVPTLKWLAARDTTGKTPHCYFGWAEGNPIAYLFRFILFGGGDTAPVTHEVLREAEPERKQRPAIHVGGR
jgi:hypothetical protein